MRIHLSVSLLFLLSLEHHRLFSDIFYFQSTEYLFSLPAFTFVLFCCLLETQSVYVQLNKTDNAHAFCSNVLANVLEEDGEAITLQGPQWLVIQRLLSSMGRLGSALFSPLQLTI